MRNPEYEFIPVDVEELEQQMIASYEALSGETVTPASPERLMIAWVAQMIVYNQVKFNYSANQNLPSRAEGENLDALAELFYGASRPDATPAMCTVRFHISEAQPSAVVIAAGTRLTDNSQTLYWELVDETVIPIGDTYVDALVRCQTPGATGNGYVIGQINTIVDLYDYCSAVENITESDGGSDQLSDSDFYDYLRASLDGFSTAGAKGGYIYHAKAVSAEIVDVVVASPSAGEVRLYVLDADGQSYGSGTTYPGKAGATLKALVLDACNADDVRPLTDHVLVADPTEVAYNVVFTYYVSAANANLGAQVNEAVQEYIKWQQSKLGRDINPSKLISLLMSTGIKRVAITSPSYVHLSDSPVPEIGKIGTITITNGGVEDD